MITVSNFQLIFKELDQLLHDKRWSGSLILMGSSGLVAKNISDRATVDVDIAFPKLNSVLKEAANLVSHKFHLPHDWLNDAGASFAKQLPDGWQDRSQNILNGKALTIAVLNLDDLIKLKCLAYFDRQKDSDLMDLISLNPNSSQLASAEKWMLQIREPEESSTDIKKFFAQMTQELKNATR